MVLYTSFCYNVKSYFLFKNSQAIKQESLWENYIWRMHKLFCAWYWSAPLGWWYSVNKMRIIAIVYLRASVFPVDNYRITI